MRVLEELLWFQDNGLEPECISCKKTKMDWCCGHFKTVGAQSGLRYDLNNTFLQCNFYCNQNLSGNIEGNKNTRGFRLGLLERFGEDHGQELIGYCETHTDPRKWEWQELQENRAEYAARIRELEQCLMD